MALPVSRLVRVAVDLSPLAASVRSFGDLLIAGDSSVINGLERILQFGSYEEVTALFGTSAPESQAAALYFGQVPQPSQLSIGRWLRTATGGQNIGGILTAAQSAITQWNIISSGGVDIAINGSAQNLSGLNFTAQTNLNGVATIITTALSGAVCTWDGQKFTITSSLTGAGASATGTISLDTNPSAGVQASGTITLTGQPSNGDTVTIKGTAVTFVTGTPSGNQVQISAIDDTHTATNLQAFLQASADANLSAMTYNTIGLVTTITAVAYGTGGNAYTLVKSGTNISVSGSGNLSGGVAADTLTVNGTAITFVAVAPSGSQVLVASTVAGTAANLQMFLQNSTNSNIDQATYSTTGTLTTVTYLTTGTAGNSFTLTKSSSHITLSGAVLSGGVVASSVGFATAGAGTDISALLKLTSATNISLVPGYNSESPADCAAALADFSPDWYGLMFAASVQPTNDQSLAVSAVIQALNVSRIYGVTVTDPNVLSPLVTNDLASLQSAAGYLRSMCQYSSTSLYAIASLIGRAFSVDFNANNSTITLMYKQEPGITGEDLSTTEANTLQAKRCNVFVDYVNDTKIIQYGVMSGPAYIDEIHGTDWLQNAVQTACYNLMYTSPTKIPQTDAGSNQFVNAIGAVMQQAGSDTGNGLVGPGIWTGPSFGTLKTGDYLKTGYYIYVQPMALQSQGDREARKCPPIQIAAHLAGAIQEIDCLISVNR